ncbi:MAG: type II toxin-antitoxin system VapC family toxin [Thiohalospira sp.]
MIVVDVNVIVHLLTDTDRHPLAMRIYGQEQQWRVPPLWRHEMLNILATMTRNDVLDGRSAGTLWHNALGLFTPREQQPAMDQALEIAIEHGISAYDAQYVTLAMGLDTLLVSEDRKLQQRLPHRVLSMAAFAADD